MRSINFLLTYLLTYNLYIHGSIATVFDKNVAEKLSNKNVLHFPTSPNYCFYTTWENRKHRNCVFSLKCCVLFYQKTRNTVLKYHLVRAEQHFAVKTFDWVHHTGPRKEA